MIANYMNELKNICTLQNTRKPLQNNRQVRFLLTKIHDDDDNDEGEDKEHDIFDEDEAKFDGTITVTISIISSSSF